jgi:site-specific DNA-methyltransferase (adenine-specific)
MKEYQYQAGPLIRLFHGNFLRASGNSVGTADLIITSPPYNLGKKYNGHDDQMEYPEYRLFNYDWLVRAKEFSHETTRLCVNVPLDKNLGGHRSVYADLTYDAQDAGWEYFTTIIWNEGTISRRTAWGSWMSPAAPHVITPVEAIVVFSLGEWKRKEPGRKGDITRDEFIAWTNGLWTFNGESAKRVGHPSPFPVELPRRLIKLFSYPGDRVLDPFVGSGTTLVACQESGRLGVGFDIDSKAIRVARGRLGI